RSGTASRAPESARERCTSRRGSGNVRPRLPSDLHADPFAPLSTEPQESRSASGPLAARELDLLDAWWRAANYLSVGQIYLLDNPLLREPLRTEHIKPRLLGHWGTTPGLNFIYAHLNRVIRQRDLSAIFIAGPGHGGPAVVANSYLEGTYTELYPEVTRDE